MSEVTPIRRGRRSPRPSDAEHRVPGRTLDGRRRHRRRRRRWSSPANRPARGLAAAEARPDLEPRTGRVECGLAEIDESAAEREVDLSAAERRGLRLEPIGSKMAARRISSASGSAIGTIRRFRLSAAMAAPAIDTISPTDKTAMNWPHDPDRTPPVDEQACRCRRLMSRACTGQELFCAAVASRSRQNRFSSCAVFLGSASTNRPVAASFAIVRRPSHMGDPRRRGSP